MDSYRQEIIFGSVLFLIFAALIIWFSFIQPQSALPIVIGTLILLIGLVTFIKRTIAKKRSLEAGTPTDDEFTRLAKVYAGNQAFSYSMYLWLLIFVFNSSFTKNETMLGIGILGSALIYGISLWYFKTTGRFNA
jgi:hypothetical protein